VALEIQIGTGKAKANLAALESSVARLEAKMKGFNSGGFTKAINGIGTAKPVSPAVAASVDKTNKALGKTPAAAAKAKAGLNGLRTSATQLRATMGLLTSGLAIVGVTSFAKGAWDMVKVVDKLGATFKGMTGGVRAGAEALKFVTAESRRTATPLKENINNFTKMSIIGNKLGFTQKTVNKAFSDGATMLRAFGADAQQTNRFMNALTQVMAKGKGTAEELRQQMGEIAPILPFIARAAGQSMGELEANMANGLVTVQQVFDGMALAATESAGIMQEMLKTASAQAIIMSNEWSALQLAFGQSVIPALIPVFQTMAQVFKGMAGDMDGAGSSARTLGVALGGAAQVVGILTPLLIGMGAAFLIIKANAAAGAILAWAGAIGASGVAAASAATSFIAGGSGAVMMSGSMAAGATSAGVFGRALLVARAGALALMTSFGPLLAIIAGGTAIWIAYNAIVGDGEKKQKNVANAAGIVVEEFKKQAKVMADAKKATTLNYEAIDTLASKEIQAGQEAHNASVQIQKLERSGQAVSPALRAAAAGASALAGASKSASGQMDKGAASANKLAAAIKAIPSSKKITITTEHKSINRQTGGELGLNSFDSDNLVDRELGGGGTSSSNARDADGFLLSNFAKGGVTGRGGHGGGTLNAAKYSFANAPHFANGGTSGIGAGGIPSVLHPNEAVIPLSSGAVPVQMKGGGGGGAMIRFLKAGNLNTSRLLDRVDQQSTFQREHFRKVDGHMLKTNTLLDKIHTMLRFDIKFMTDSIVNAIGTIQSSGGGGSFGSGGDFSGGSAFDGGGGSSAAPVDLAAARTQLDKLIRDRSKGGGVASVLAPEFNFNGGRTRKPGDVDKAIAASRRNTELAKAREEEIGQLQEILGLQKDIIHVRDNTTTAEDFKPRYNINIMPFAKGTPNTSKENGLRQTGSGGGMLAQLHPNEAVIPLPDGRSVPVTLNGGAGETGGGGGGGNINVTINMNVDATDAASFARSKQQMMQDLTLDIKRAMRNVGEPDSSDLSRPTQRVVKRG